MPRIKQIIDLSHPLTSTTPVYPGDPVPSFSVATTVEKEGYNLFTLVLGSQTGSHVDAPYHFNNQGATIDKMALKTFMGNGVIIDMTHKKAREEFSLAEVQQYDEAIKGAEIVLFRTDWYLKAGTEAFFEHPYLSAEAGEHLLSMGIRCMGIDAINLDSTGGTQFPIHDMVSAAGGIIAENLAYLDRVTFDHPFIICLPLRLIGCDGSPVRAVAVEFE